MTQLFTVVGTTNFQGQTKVRWANDLVTRIKMLHKAGHKDIELHELPQPMNKFSALKWLSNHPEFSTWSVDSQYTITNKLAEFNRTAKRSEFKISFDNSQKQSVMV